jgi:uncharacterized protein YjiS (DUF1127 family)
MQEYRRRRRAGRPTTDLVDAAPVRAHVHALMDIGATRTQIRVAAPVSEGWLTALLSGHRRRGRAPSQRVSPAPARRILALPLEPTLVIADQLVHSWTNVSGAGPQRRVRALYALGYAPSWQADQIGMPRSTMSYLVNTPDRAISARYAARLHDLYEKYWDVRPEGPEADTARAAAAARGWVLLPADWDDDLIDLPQAALDARIDQMVAAMSPAELASASTSYSDHGDRSPLTIAATRAYRRRRRARTTGSSPCTNSTPAHPNTTSSPPAPTSSAAAGQPSSRSATSTTTSPQSRPGGGRTPSTRARASASRTTPAPRRPPTPSLSGS